MGVSLIKKIAIFLLLVFGCISCSKDKKTCWQAFDPLGFVVNGLELCDKTKLEAETAYPQFWFYESSETRSCWRVQHTNGNVFYARNIPTSMAHKLWEPGGYLYTTVDCNSFCTWRIFEKQQSKITGLFKPVIAYTETLFADTCTKLFEGKIVIYRETNDSLITREFVNKL